MAIIRDERLSIAAGRLSWVKLIRVPKLARPARGRKLPTPPTAVGSFHNSTFRWPRPNVRTPWLRSAPRDFSTATRPAAGGPASPTVAPRRTRQRRTAVASFHAAGFLIGTSRASPAVRAVANGGIVPRVRHVVTPSGGRRSGKWCPKPRTASPSPGVPGAETGDDGWRADGARPVRPSSTRAETQTCGQPIIGHRRVGFTPPRPPREPQPVNRQLGRRDEPRPTKHVLYPAADRPRPIRKRRSRATASHRRTSTFAIIPPRRILR
jgi:hypothetical protein